MHTKAMEDEDRWSKSQRELDAKALALERAQTIDGLLPHSGNAQSHKICPTHSDGYSQL